jgi:hypothetical protein
MRALGAGAVMRIRVLDLDGSLRDQPPIARRLMSGNIELHDLRSQGPALRLWTLGHHFAAFDRFWCSLPRDRQPVLTLVGSGDFHHLTTSFIAAADGPLTVLHFDNHPDWCWTMPRRHCGSWTHAVLGMNHVARLITIGPCSEDLVRPDRKGANTDALSTGRLELYPWWHAPSTVERSGIADGPGHRVADGALHWRNLAGDDWRGFLDELVQNITTEKVWITIDKDVLPPAHAVTNWDQGGLPLDNLVEAILRIAGRFRIVGADICGEYAPIRHRNPLKYLEAWLDQPRGPDLPDLAVNARTNERLIAAFEEAL